MADRRVRVRFEADDALAQAMRRAAQASKDLARQIEAASTSGRQAMNDLQKSQQGVVAGWREIAKGTLAGQVAFDALQRGVRMLTQAFRNFAQGGLEFTRQIAMVELQFKSLLGGMDAAQARMRDLVHFAARTPFRLPEVAKASRLMQVFTGSLASSGEGLRLIGDAAAGVGTDLRHVAFWVGRMLFLIEQGQPFGEAALRMQELGLMTGETRSKLEALTKTGQGQVEALEILTKEWAKYKGLTQELSRTIPGLESTFLDLKEMFAATIMEGTGLKRLYTDLLTLANQWMSTRLATTPYEADMARLDELTTKIERIHERFRGGRVRGSPAVRAALQDLEVEYFNITRRWAAYQEAEAEGPLALAEYEMDRLTREMGALRERINEGTIAAGEGEFQFRRLEMQYYQNAAAAQYLASQIGGVTDQQERYANQLRLDAGYISGPPPASLRRPGPLNLVNLDRSRRGPVGFDGRYLPEAAGRMPTDLIDLDRSRRGPVGFEARYLPEAVRGTAGRGGFAGVDWAGSFSRAFQGGGGITGAAQSVFAQGLFGEGGALKGAMEKMGGIGGGAFASGMLAAIGFGLQKVTELIADWWKKEERLVNDMRDTWKDMTNDVLEGTLSVETAARTASIALRHGKDAGDEARQHALYMEDLADAFEAVGLSAQHALEWERKRINETNPAVLEGLYAQLAVIGRLKKAQDELADAIGKTEQAANDWGISMDEIGLDFFSAQAVSDMALLAEQFSLLQNTGMTALQIISGAGDEVIDRLYNIGQAAVRFGLDVPAALKPAFEALLNEGRITQTQFDSMSFDTAENNMAGSINRLVTEIGNLIDAINEAFRPRFTQNAIVNDVTTRHRTVDPETGQTTWHGDTIRFGDVGGFNLDPISIPEVVTDADGNVVSVGGTPTGLGGTRTQVGPVRPNPWGDPRRTGTGGGRGGAGGAGGAAARAAEEARRFALQYRLNAIRAYLGRLREEKTEKERLLKTNEDLLDQYHDLSRAMSLGDLTFSQFDAYLSRMQDLGRLTEKAAKGMRDMARAALYDPSAADSAAGRLGITMTGDTYRKHATARELDQLLRDYQAVAQGGNTPAQIQTLFERQHTGWLANIAASMNQGGMSLAEAHEQHGRESTLLRIKRLLQDAAGFGLRLPREFMPLVKGLRGGGSVMGQGALAGLRSLVGGRDYAPLMGLGQVHKPQWSVNGGAPAGGVWTEQTLFDQLTGGLQQALQENIKDPLTEQIGNLTSAIAGLAGAIAHFERQERAVERDLNTPPDQRAREDALKQWAKSTFGVNLYSGEVANLLSGTSMYYGTMRGILGGWGNTPRAGATMSLAQFDRMYPRASSRTGTLGFDHARHGYGAAAGQPSNPVHFRAAGGPLGLGWNVVGEVGPEAIHYQRGRAPMVYSASRTRSGGGQPIVIRNVIELDGRVVAENQRKHLPDVLDEYGDAA